jgi:DNA-binding NarL/FixJ family response regulator
MAVTDAPRLLLELDADLRPDLVVLELSRRELSQDLRVVEELARRGGAVIAVTSGSAACAAVLAAGARACLDKDAAFTDRLAEAVRGVAGSRMSAPPSRRDAGPSAGPTSKSPLRSGHRADDPATVRLKTDPTTHIRTPLPRRPE